MKYVYEGVIDKMDGEWFVTIPDFGRSCVSSDIDFVKACSGAQDVLGLFISDYIENHKKLPKPHFDPSDPGKVIVCVDVDNSYIASTHRMTPSKVAEFLGISRPMVSKLLNAGKLDSVMVNGRRQVTVDSVNRYMNEHENLQDRKKGQVEQFA